jgi:type I restriction enzyme S subunit
MTVLIKTNFKQTEVGMIPDDWEVKRLDEITLNITDGKHGDCINQENSGYYFISCKDIADRNIHYEDAREITQSDFEATQKRTKLEVGDVLVTNSGTIGRLAIARDPDTVSRTTFQKSVAILKPSLKLVSSEFLYYALSSSMRRLIEAAGGTTQKNLLLKDLRDFLIPFCGPLEQFLIARILSNLDSKIEVNQQMSKTLEAISQAVFKHWFFDFEFPNDEGNPYKSSGGEMTYNDELEREIPKSWEGRPFSEVIAVNPKRELKRGHKVKKVGMADLNPWQAHIENWAYAEYTSGPKFKNGDTLFARITPSLEHGKTAFVSILDGQEVGFGSTEFIVFGKSTISSDFYIFHLSRSEEIRNAAIRAMTGTSGRQRVPDDLFERVPIVLPPSPLINRFDALASAQFNQIALNAQEMRTLSQIRDSLLPKLLSGKVRVPVEVR